MDISFPKTLTFETHQRAVRLDVFLTQNFSDYTRGDIVRAIKDGFVSVNDKNVKPHHALRMNDVIVVEKIEKKNIGTLIPNKEVVLDVIEEHDDFLVINKPVGLQVHPSERGEQDTLVNALIAQYPEIASIGDNSLRPGIVHRLDKDTSGVMIVAKTAQAFDGFKELFHDHGVEKTYIALVHGVPKEKSGTIDLPIARAATYTKQKVVYGVPTPDAREAHTEYCVTETFDTPQGKFSLVELHPHTGRMHQVRVHMAAIGNPLVGDVRYYTRHKKDILQKEDSTLGVAHHLLHAKELVFIYKKTAYAFNAPLPERFETVLKKIAHKT